METTSYSYDFDATKKRYYIQMSGELNAEKIHETFLKVMFDHRITSRYRDIIWILKHSIIPKSFSYGQVLKKADSIRALMPAGKTAIVIESNSPAQEELSKYYKSVSVLSTDRQVEVFNSIADAERWFECELPRFQNR